MIAITILPRDQRTHGGIVIILLLNIVTKFWAKISGVLEEALAFDKAGNIRVYSTILLSGLVAIDRNLRCPRNYP